MPFTDQQVFNQIQYTVIEPPDNGATWPSGLWTADEVIRYTNQRQNRFLKDTHLQIGIADIAATTNVIQYALPDDWINTVRVMWVAQSGAIKELTRSDVWEADNGIPTWTQTAGVPLIYMDSNSPPLTIKIAPKPSQNGVIRLHYVPYSPAIDGTGERIVLPSEYVPALKYGILADMFSKVGRANDPARADYCTQRYQLGIELSRMLLKGWKS